MIVCVESKAKVRSVLNLTTKFQPFAKLLNIKIVLPSLLYRNNSTVIMFGKDTISNAFLTTYNKTHNFAHSNYTPERTERR